MLRELKKGLLKSKLRQHIKLHKTCVCVYVYVYVSVCVGLKKQTMLCLILEH